MYGARGKRRPDGVAAVGGLKLSAELNDFENTIWGQVLFLVFVLVDHH